MYVDESGDWGYGREKSSKTFVLAAFMTSNSKEEIRAIHDMHERNTRVSEKRIPPPPDELKHVSSKNYIRLNVARDLSKIDSKIKAIEFKKRTEVANEKEAYAKMAAAIIDDVMKDPLSNDGVEVIFDGGQIDKRTATKIVEIAARKYGRTLSAQTIVKTRDVNYIPELFTADFAAGIVRSRGKKAGKHTFKEIKPKTRIRQIKFQRN